VLPALGISRTVLGTSFQQNATLLRSVRGWGSQTSSNGGETPFLDVGLDKDESSLSEVDVDSSRAVCADGGEEVLRLETVDYLFELLTIACEEDSTSPRSVTHADNIALYQWGPVRSGAKWLVIAASTGRLVSNRVLVVA
jgi:hypothetical protein